MTGGLGGGRSFKQKLSFCSLSDIWLIYAECWCWCWCSEVLEHLKTAQIYLQYLHVFSISATEDRLTPPRRTAWSLGPYKFSWFSLHWGCVTSSCDRLCRYRAVMAAKSSGKKIVSTKEKWVQLSELVLHQPAPVSTPEEGRRHSHSVAVNATLALAFAYLFLFYTGKISAEKNLHPKVCESRQSGFHNKIV